jgi:hypothetical protein
MNQPGQSDGSALSSVEGDRLIRLFADSFSGRSPAGPGYWQPALTDLHGRVVHALPPLLVEQSPAGLTALHWVQPPAPAPAQSATPVSDQSPVRPAVKPTL